MHIKNILTAYIDRQQIITTMDLLNEFKKDLSIVNVEVNVSLIDNARDAIDELLLLCEKLRVKALFIDEFTSLLRKFGRFSPFKDSGGVRSLAEFLRSIIEDSKVTIVALDTSIKSVYDLILNYTSPLLRIFHKVLFLDPLPAEYAVELIEKLMKIRKNL